MQERCSRWQEISWSCSLWISFPSTLSVSLSPREKQNLYLTVESLCSSSLFCAAFRLSGHRASVVGALNLGREGGGGGGGFGVTGISLSQQQRIAKSNLPLSSPWLNSLSSGLKVHCDVLLRLTERWFNRTKLASLQQCLLGKLWGVCACTYITREGWVCTLQKDSFKGLAGCFWCNMTYTRPLRPLRWKSRVKSTSA